ncbi:MAG: XRE family transcriptional regulator [Bacteroidetes bacterium]|nr:MAG: XRE family transcriptional regulator [Bacteroidota bacterium]
MAIGQKIKKVREFKNFTQEHLAEKLGMSVAGYGKIEREETDVPFSRLEQIAATFNMKTEDLVGFDEQTVFNIMHNQTGINHFYNGSISNDIIENFKKTIQLLEEKVAVLEKVQK